MQPSTLVSKGSINPNIELIPDTHAQTDQQPQVVVNGELRLPNSVNSVSVTHLPPKMDDFTQHVKYLAELIDSMARLAINACMAGLTWMAAQAQFSQRFDYAQKVAETIKEVAEFAKKHCLPQQPAAPQNT